MDQIIEVYGNPIGFETLAVSSSAVGFTATKYSNVSSGGVGRGDARAVLITVDGTPETNDIRWTVDGTAPVGDTTGHLLQSQQSLFIRGYNNIKKFRAIRDGDADTTLQCTFFG